MLKLSVKKWLLFLYKAGQCPHDEAEVWLQYCFVILAIVILVIGGNENNIVKTLT